MKILNKYMKSGLFCMMAMVAGLATVACEDEPDKYEVASGVPTVRYIRSPYAASADSLLTAATTGSTICLVGENLRSIYELYFNDRQAILNNSYITDNTLLVDVPQSIPGEVSDKIYMVTRSGQTVEFDFHVTVPAPTLTAMSCEYAPVGSEVTITGNYFVDDPNVPLQVVFPGDVPVTEFTDITQSSISFIMPECTEEGPVEVTTIYGTTASAFQYLDTRGMMFDFDDMTGLTWQGWHERPILADETSITGNFVQLGDGATTMSADGGWNDSQFSFEYWAGSWDNPQNVTSGNGMALFNLVDFTDYQNMSLKFELYIPSSNPWSAGAMQIAFEGFDMVTISGNPIEGYNGYVAGAQAYIFNGDGTRDEGSFGRAMYRPWTTSGSYHTNDQWVTVTIPLTSFTYDRLGAAATSVPNSPDDFASLTIFVMGGGVNGTECTPIFKIDNIRAVPNR